MVWSVKRGILTSKATCPEYFIGINFELILERQQTHS